MQKLQEGRRKNRLSRNLDGFAGKITGRNGTSEGLGRWGQTVRYASIA